MNESAGMTGVGQRVGTRGQGWPFVVLVATGVAVVGVLAFAMRPSRRVERPMAVGDTVVLDGAGTEAVLLADAHDPNAWDVVLDAMTRQDREGLAALVRDHKAFWVANGTRARVLELSALKERVRILEGPRSVAEGWVPREFSRLED